MEIRALRFAVTLAEELHFGRASRRHFISEQPFGRQIRLLEQEVGVKIFDRTSRRVVLTPGGAAFIARAREILDGIDDLAGHTHVTVDMSGPFRLGVLGFGAADRWPGLRTAMERQNPGLLLEHVDLDFVDQHLAVSSGAVDAGIVQYVGEMPGLRFDALFDSRRVVVVPADSPLVGAPALAWDDLGEQRWLGVPRGGADFARWLGPVGDGFAGAPVVRNPASIPAAVATTGRVCLHGELAEKYYPHPGVRYVPLDGAPVRIAVATRIGDERPEIRSLLAACRAMSAA